MESAGEHGQLVLSEIPDVQEVQATLFQLVGDEHQRLAREENYGVMPVGAPSRPRVSLRSWMA